MSAIKSDGVIRPIIGLLIHFFNSISIAYATGMWLY